ncbi:MotE family protein [Anaerosinus massiliensis]|uniref:MotE family protein n=1 Tax=Massilibacillus massiliensis TaxID=1806837 RepID=UPI000DA63354|nr:magnesium transporter MgtE [Massilibacillus massiliensis]
MAANKAKSEESTKKIEELENEFEDDEEFEEEEKQSLFLRITKILVAFFVILALIIGGFFLGVYLRVFDVSQVNEKLGLYNYPIIGQYFEKPLNAKSETQETNNSDKPGEPIIIPDSKNKDGSNPDDPLKLTEEEKKPDASKPLVLDKAEIDKQLKIRQAEEKKRISKLARLYGAMKPEEAVPILESLDDDMIISILGKMDESQVSKLLPKFDASRSARLTRLMYNGKPAVNQVR